MTGGWTSISNSVYSKRTGNPSLIYVYDIGELWGEPAIRVRRIWHVLGDDIEESPEHHGYVVLPRGAHIIPSSPPLYVLIDEDGWDVYDLKPDGWPDDDGHRDGWLKYCNPGDIHFYLSSGVSHEHP